jgi:cytochrome oxidase Cu insertion factor (SCO1/SenC/PrrC family)
VPRRYALALAALGVVALVGAGFAAERLVGARDSGAAYRGSPPPPGIVLPDFALRDESGTLVRSDELGGKVVLVPFLETQCKESCPVVARQIGQALDRLRADERAGVVALAFSTHPGDDTPAAARAFVRRHGVQGRLHYLVGSEKDLRPLWDEFDVLPAVDTGDADLHSVPVRIFAASGEWVSTLHPGADLSPENLAHDLRLALG